MKTEKRVRASIYLIGIVLLFIFPMLSYAQIPQTVSYQGYLTDAGGAPVDTTASGPVTIYFSIYDVDTGGVALWGDKQAVNVNQGVYSVVFGEDPLNPLALPFDRQYYLGVRVESDPEMTPRQPLTAVPYALNADRIDGRDLTDLGDITAVNSGTGLSGGGTAGDVTLSANTAYLQRRVTGACAAGQSIREISATGTVTCEIDDGIGTETDPVFGASAASGITGTNLSNWNAAYAWGNHASAGYDTTNDSWVGTGNVYLTTGNVGIGTSSPSANLHIYDSAGATGGIAGGSDLLIDSGNGQRYITMRGPVSGQTGLLFSNADSSVDGGLRYWPSATAGSDRLELMSGGSGGLNVLGSGNIGIGTSAPSYPLHVVDDRTTTSPTIYGVNTTADWWGVGVKGESLYKGVEGRVSATGAHSYYGVYGYASTSDTTGTPYGGYFSASGAQGRGVYGYASSSTGTNYGGYFSANGDDGRAVYGNATGLYGRGGYFEVDGQYAQGVYATNTYNSGTVSASLATAGTGVIGFHSIGNYGWVGTATKGIYGQNGATNGRGVDGYAYGSGGVGVYAVGGASNGTGIYAQGGTSGYAGHFRGKVKIASRSTGATVMELGEGLDYAEGFNVTDESQIQAGTVLIIDEENPGKLKMSVRGYDTRVAGIVAGANNLGSGVRLGAGEFDHDVALAGRVYCNVDATEHGIKPGDLLTTSNSAGYAMKAADHGRSQGAILGKAMESLEKGKKGQILVLVTLQ